MNYNEENTYNPPGSTQLSAKTFECFVCAKNGFPGVPIYLKGKDEKGFPVRIELDKVTPHRHRGSKTTTITASAQQSQEQKGLASYDVASDLHQIKAAIAELDSTMKGIKKAVDAVYFSLKQNQQMADSEAQYDQDKEDGLA